MDKKLTLATFVAGTVITLTLHFFFSPSITVREGDVNHVTVLYEQKEMPRVKNGNSINEQEVRREDIPGLTGQSLEVTDDVEKRSESNSKANGVGQRLF